MSGRAEQLHYTWTPRGVEGANRFQIASISPGLRSGPAAAAMPMVRRICSYEPPRGAEGDFPVSFGWVDHDDHRIAFHRVGLPPARGRPGNFAAHVLVGPRQALPEALVGRSFGSSLWWRGATEEELEAIAAGKREFELSAIDLEEALRSAQVEEETEDLDAAMSLAHAALTLPAEARLAVLAEGSPMGWVVKTVAERMPEALTGLSLSTYEGKPFFPFQVIGTTAPDPAMLRCPLAASSLEASARAALERLLSEDPVQAPLRSLAESAARKSPEPRAALWSTACAAVGISIGEPADARSAVELMGEPDAVLYLATTVAGRESLAAAAQAGEPAVLAALAQAAPRMDPDLHEGLCAAIVERYAENPQLRGCAGLLASLAAGPAKDAALDRLFLIAADDDEAAAGLDAADAVLLLAVAARRGADAGSVEDLLRATARHLGACAAAPSLPDAYLRAMLRNRISDPGATAAIARAIRARPRLIAADAGADIEPVQLLDLAERADRECRATLLPLLLPKVAGAPWAGRAIAVTRLLPPATAGRIVAAVLRDGGSAVACDELSELCDSLAATLLAQGDRTLALELLQQSGSGQARRAHRLLRDATGGSGSRAIEAARKVAVIGDEELREAVAEIVLDRAVAAIAGTDDVDRVWFALTSLHPLASEAERLRRLFACAVARPQELSAALVLGWTASALVDRHPKLMDRRGHLDDSESEEMAREMVTGISEWRMAQVAETLEFERRRGRKWWNRLESHRKKIDDGGEG